MQRLDNIQPLALNGTLQVTVVNCRDLDSKDVLTSQDPYVILKVGSQKQKTSVKKHGGRNVDFGETFSFYLDESVRDGLLHVGVWDKDLLTMDDSIGYADLPISAILKYSKPKSYQLLNKTNSKRIAGYITLQVTFAGSGLPEGHIVDDDKRVYSDRSRASTRPYDLPYGGGAGYYNIFSPSFPSQPQYGSGSVSRMGGPSSIPTMGPSASYSQSSVPYSQPAPYSQPSAPYPQPSTAPPSYVPSQQQQSSFQPSYQSQSSYQQQPPFQGEGGVRGGGYQGGGGYEGGYGGGGGYGGSMGGAGMMQRPPSQQQGYPQGYQPQYPQVGSSQGMGMSGSGPMNGGGMGMGSMPGPGSMSQPQYNQPQYNQSQYGGGQPMMNQQSGYAQQGPQQQPGGYR